MGQPDQFAKRTFAHETPVLTQGAVEWQDPPEISITKVQEDGRFVVLHDRLPLLDPPWPEVVGHDEVQVEIKMAGDHLSVVEIERLLLRRQARQVQRIEDREAPFRGQLPVWAVAPHVPEVLRDRFSVSAFAEGCYRVGPAAFSFLWIAANELPLRDDLIPFLVARSGRALDDFARWVVPRRPATWVLDMVDFTAMSNAARVEVTQSVKTDELAVLARQARTFLAIVKVSPEARAQAAEILGGEARLAEFADSLERRLDERVEWQRSALRRVLARRGFVLSPEQEVQIDECDDLGMLELWLDQAVDARSAAEALS